jgi:hypothetical protein
MATRRSLGYRVTIITIILMAIPAVVGVFDIVSRAASIVRSPEKALVAEVSYGVQRTAPSTQRFLAGLAGLARLDNDSLWMHDLAVDEILRAQDKSADSSDIVWNKRQIVWKVQSILRAFGIGPSVESEQRGPAGYWSVLVSNAGSKELRNVRLTLPGATEAWIEYPESTASTLCAGNTIRIAEMQPREQAIVFAFTQYGAPSRYDKGRIQLTHDDGIGKVRLLVPCGSMGQWFDSSYNWVLMFLVFFWLLFAIVSFFIAKAQARTGDTH